MDIQWYSASSMLIVLGILRLEWKFIKKETDPKMGRAWPCGAQWPQQCQKDRDLFLKKKPRGGPPVAGRAAGRAAKRANFRAISGEFAPPQPPKPGRPRGTQGSAGPAPVFPARAIKKIEELIKGNFVPAPGSPAGRRPGRD